MKFKYIIAVLKKLYVRLKLENTQTQHAHTHLYNNSYQFYVNNIIKTI